MNCYQCTDVRLKPIKLESALPAKQCDQCGGTHIDLLSYRNWRENTKLVNQEQSTAEPVETSDNKKALICQKCSKLMLKFRFSNKHDNVVDVCSHCDDVWLDSGEWELLNQLDIQNQLTQIMTAPWQKNLKQQHFAAIKQEQYLKQLGEEDLQTVKSFSQWLKDHPNKSLIERYIRTNT
ncbi:MAG: hypothetical protein HRU38_10075 [Saccharospirillaceae bacterium]|nr:hypothetical protein [Pseudomonadales bacterium]NRB78999.1 hypothetical protein [Saccharospirillaceae bacterium]